MAFAIQLPSVLRGCLSAPAPWPTSDDDSDDSDDDSDDSDDSDDPDYSSCQKHLPVSVWGTLRASKLPKASICER